jgi:inhibitor of KinA
MRFSPLGDRAVHIELGSSIDEATHRLVRAVCARLDDQPPAGFIEYVPGFTSVVVHYEPLRVEAGADGLSPHARMEAALTDALYQLGDEELPPARVVEIPVCYGGDLGPDLEDVARAHSLTPDDVVRMHAAGDYLVYMLGFMPGFAYLGGLAPELATPRRPTPRTHVPALSVGIGGSQTGVYPLESPGGWHLIGRTPRAVFLPAANPPTLLRMGDRVRFVAISPDEYRARVDAAAGRDEAST